MCGFTGFVTRSAPPDQKALHAMGEAIRHRGPDGEGHYTDEHCGIAHRRLSIIDLEKGRQPIVSPTGGISSPTTARPTTSASSGRS